MGFFKKKRAPFLYALLPQTAVLLFFIAGVSAAPEEETSGPIGAAIDYARKGDFKESLAMFDSLTTKFPYSPEVFREYVVVLAWAGKCRKAVTVFEKKFEQGEWTPPYYVLKEAAKCYRNLKMFDKSVEKYNEALLHRKDLDSVIGLTFALSENGESDKAFNLLKEQINKHQKKRSLQLALAYLYEGTGEYLKAILIYNRLLEKKRERKVLDARVRALSRMGAHTPAMEAALAANTADTALLDYLKGNFAARLISWSRNTPPDENRKNRWKDLNRSIKILTEQLERDRDNRRALYDLMGARVLMEHPKGILKTYNRLKQEKSELPNWVLEIVADAYRETNQPDPAITIYTGLLKTDPENYYWLKKLYSAYVLKNDLTRASSILNKLLQKERSPGILVDGVKAPNWKKVELETSRAWMLAFMDRLSEAQDRFDSLLSKAPHNSSIHSGLAHTYLWRGHTLRALREFQWILNYDPTYTAVRTGYTAALLELKRYRDAEKEVKKLSSVYPVSRQIEKITDRWKALNRPGFSVDGNLVREERGGKDLGADFRLYSRLVRYRYRFDITYSKRQSRADSDREDYSRLGVGMIYEKERAWTFSQRLTFDPQKDEDFGSVTSLNFTPNDYITVSGEYDSFILDLPLRARINGVDGKSYTLSSRFSPDERISLSVHASTSRYTDSNSRRIYSLSYRQKIIPGFKYRAFFELNVHIGTNSLKGADYFNPEQESGYSLTSVNEFTTVNLFGKRFIQHLNLSLGQYRQRGFSAGLTADFRYEHRWDITAGRELLYGAHWKRRVYDGESEQTTGVYASFRYHL